MEDILLVDVDDNEIGYGNKEETHKYGTLHRAFSVFLFHDNMMLLQKRNINKYHSGGLWTNACCSHQRKGESLEDAVKRGLQSELGIQPEVKEIFHFTYRTKFNNELYEYEIDHVFIGNYGGPLTWNPEEAEIVEWITVEDLKKKMLNVPDIFTSWFLIAAPKVLEMRNN